ncbi:polysaccharide pyruvyl transferase family protein [Bosea sp. LjRoot90]|uniref:polysaccharide pyruvyl transferase family protein n=1 Tax=Bosea sp. LjRoot90 TaxID=3342342 RepID=UPI003ECDF17C
MSWISARLIRGNRGDIASRYSILSHVIEQGSLVSAVFAENALHVPSGQSGTLHPYGPLYNFWPGWKGLQALRKARAVIWTGGLDLQDDSSLIKLVHTWFVFLSYRLLGLKILLANQGAGPLTTSAGRWLAKQVLRQVSVALVRDKGSYDLLRPLMDERRLMLGADGIFLAEPWRSGAMEGGSAPRGGQPVIGLNLRMWFHFSNSWVPYQFARRRYNERAREPMARVVAAASAAVAALRERHDARIMLFSMYEPDVENWEDDRWLLEQVKANFASDDNVQLAGGNPTIVELCREFSELDLMIGMRLHSTLLALRAGVPAIHLAYTLKGHDIYADLGLSDWVVPVEGLLEGQQELIALASRILSDPASSLRVRDAVARIVDANGAALTAALRRVEQS